MIREGVDFEPPFTTADEATLSILRDGAGNPLVRVYPGGRVVLTTFDGLDRATQIAVGAQSIASITSIGRRVAAVEYGAAVIAAFSWEGSAPSATSFGVRRLAESSVTGPSGVIDHRSYRWDRNQNRVQTTDLRVGGPQQQLSLDYDALDRLVASTIEDAGGAPVDETVYTLDRVGNRVTVDGAAYTSNPSDAAVNEYTTTPFGTVDRDANGNLIERLGATLTYDGRNRLVEWSSSGGIRHRFRYDAFGRRVAEVIDVDGVAGSPFERRLLYDGWQVIEEQEDDGDTIATYIYGRGLDEVLQMRRYGVDSFLHADAHGSIVAATDASGSVVERYEYDDFGFPTILSPSGAVRSASWIGNRILFAGRRWDAETELYDYRYRLLDPVLGRFVSRDPLGAFADGASLGNATTWVGNNPLTHRDPFGLEEEVSSSPEEELPPPLVKRRARVCQGPGCDEAHGDPERDPTPEIEPPAEPTVEDPVVEDDAEPDEYEDAKKDAERREAEDEIEDLPPEDIDDLPEPDWRDFRGKLPAGVSTSHPLPGFEGRLLQKEIREAQQREREKEEAKKEEKQRKKE
ncbi:MAG: hypothetical protein KDC38_20405, partial [Planctomycetes bacterium]|nr:hypothetical protein [Planctomycetota bacterium]